MIRKKKKHVLKFHWKSYSLKGTQKQASFFQSNFLNAHFIAVSCQLSQSPSLGFSL